MITYFSHAPKFPLIQTFHRETVSLSLSLFTRHKSITWPTNDFNKRLLVQTALSAAVAAASLRVVKLHAITLAWKVLVVFAPLLRSLLSSAFSLSTLFSAFLVSSRFVSCAVYRWDRRWRNLPSDRHAVNEHVDRSRFPHSSCMACQIAITAAAAIDIARGPTRGSCLPGGEKWNGPFLQVVTRWLAQ